MGPQIKDIVELIIAANNNAEALIFGVVRATSQP
jgi:hypothetical protein